MAGRRVGSLHSEHVRLKIKTAALVNALQDHAEGKKNMEPSQLKAAEILLKKTLPDLSAITVSGDSDKPLINEVRVSLVSKS
jgi:hypothetical protein